MAISLVFSSSVFLSKEWTSTGHMGFQRPPQGSIPRLTIVRFRRCFKVRAAQVSASAEAISGLGHMETQNLYEILGVSQSATVKDIKWAYRKLAREFHPDHAASPQGKNQNTQIFLRIHDAYVTLSDPHDRVQYDRQVSPQVRGFAGQTWKSGSYQRAPTYKSWCGHVGQNWETDQCW